MVMFSKFKFNFNSKSKLNVDCKYTLPICRHASDSASLKEALCRKIHSEIEFIKEFRKKHNDTVLGKVAVKNVYGGMRGVMGFTWETSDLDAEEGIRFRGKSVFDLPKVLPKPQGAKEPYVEALLWLLLTGDVPTEAQAKGLAEELANRGKQLPEPIMKMLCSSDPKWLPMSMMSMVLDALSNYSKFNKAFQKGVKKSEYWESYFEDGLDVIALAPRVAGLIYRKTHDMPLDPIEWNPKGDMALNFAHALDRGSEQVFVEFLRMYLILHSDHEGGNVSAHAMHLVCSALSDLYKGYSAAINGLAGPLHGLATQTCLEWLLAMQKKYGEKPSQEDIRKFVDETLKSGNVVPGYGHAVLRKTDPRFTAQSNFSKAYKIDTPLIFLVEEVNKTVPALLKKLGKVQNPYPNVDAYSGSLLKYFCIDDFTFYPVMFGVARIVGIASATIWSRALGLPIERPKSISSCLLRQKLSAQEKKKDGCDDKKKK